MAKIMWDQVGERLYETGVSKGVLYVRSSLGAYGVGVPWNGLTGVTESPSGAEASPVYADNIKYLNLLSTEEFGATVEAYTYPPEFAACDGSGELTDGVMVGQQSRGVFGLCYRTEIGNDVDGVSHGYKLHLIYGAQAAPSEKGYASINDSPDAITFSWELTTTPVSVTGFKPTASLVIDSTKTPPAVMAVIEDALYGTAEGSSSLPLPDALKTLIEAMVLVTPMAATFVAETNTITIPEVTGVVYLIDGVVAEAGNVVIDADAVVTAQPASELYYFDPTATKQWLFEYTAADG